MYTHESEEPSGHGHLVVHLVFSPKCLNVLWVWIGHLTSVRSHDQAGLVILLYYNKRCVQCLSDITNTSCFSTFLKCVQTTSCELLHVVN